MLPNPDIILPDQTEERQGQFFGLRLCLYARVSTVEQGKGYSLENQIEHSRKWATALGVDLVAIYSESKSARSDRRPQFQKLTRDITRGYIQADGVLVWSVDRFARNLYDLLSYKRLLNDHGLSLYSVTEKYVYQDSPESKLMLSVLGAIAQYDNEVRAIRSKGGQDMKAKSGTYPGASLPLGYMRKGKKRQAKILPCPTHAPHIKTAFNEFSTGKYTLKTWRAEATRRGISHSSGRNLHASDWGAIFRNVFYVGKFTWKGETYQGDHPPLVDAGIFSDVQAVLDSRGPSADQAKHSWLLRGLLWSDLHQRAMTGSKNRQYRYYRAKGRAGQPEHTIRAEQAEAQAIALLNSIRATSSGIPAKDSWVLALISVPNLGHLFPKLSPNEQKMLLKLTFTQHGLHVSPSGQVYIWQHGLRPGFSLLSESDSG